MSGRGDDAFWRNEEAAWFDEQEEKNARLRRELEKFKAQMRGLEPEKLPNLFRREMMEDFFKPEVDENHATLAANREEIAPQRGSVLKEAMDVINGERQDVYGSPEDSFQLIANYWNTYLNSVGDFERIPKTENDTVNLAASDVAMMMTLFKIAREANQHKRDNIVDAGGYLGIYADMQGVKSETV